MFEKLKMWLLPKRDRERVELRADELLKEIERVHGAFCDVDVWKRAMPSEVFRLYERQPEGGVIWDWNIRVCPEEARVITLAWAAALASEYYVRDRATEDPEAWLTRNGADIRKRMNRRAVWYNCTGRNSEPPKRFKPVKFKTSK